MIGFIGLGVMGEPMARNLVAAGHDVVVHSRTPKAIDGARSVSLEEAAATDIVITMLPDSAAVLSVADAIVAAEPGLWIDMSTIHPTVAIELSQRGVATLDAPVSGGDVGAHRGTLSIMVGGAESDYERAREILSAMGRTIVHVGGPGAGQTVKACNQIVVALTIEAVSEALVLGSKAVWTRRRSSTCSAADWPPTASWRCAGATSWSTTSRPASGSTCTTRT